MLIQANIIPKLAEFLRCPLVGIIIPTLRIIGNLFTGNFLLIIGS